MVPKKIIKELIKNLGVYSSDVKIDDSREYGTDVIVTVDDSYFDDYYDQYFISLEDKKYRILDRDEAYEYACDEVSGWDLDDFTSKFIEDMVKNLCGGDTEALRDIALHEIKEKVSDAKSDEDEDDYFGPYTSLLDEYDVFDGEDMPDGYLYDKDVENRLVDAMLRYAEESGYLDFLYGDLGYTPHGLAGELLSREYLDWSLCEDYIIDALGIAEVIGADEKIELSDGYTAYLVSIRRHE